MVYSIWHTGLLLKSLTSMNRRAYSRPEVQFGRRTLSFVNLNLFHGLRARFVIATERTAAPTTKPVSYDRPAIKKPPLVSQRITNPTSASSPHSTAARRSTDAPSLKKVDKRPLNSVRKQQLTPSSPIPHPRAPPLRLRWAHRSHRN